MRQRDNEVKKNKSKKDELLSYYIEKTERLQKEKVQHLVNESEMQETIDQHKQVIIDRDDMMRREFLDAYSKDVQHPIKVHVSGKIKIDNEEVNEVNPIPAAEKPTIHPPMPTNQTFVERVKSIVLTMATKNRQLVESRAKGYLSSYTYYINADCFCKAIDEMATKEPELLKEFLGGNLYNTQVTKICFFLGYVLKLNIINDASLQFVDLLFAFEAFYPSKLTIQKKLSNISPTPQQRVFLGIFEGLLRRFNS